MFDLTVFTGTELLDYHNELAAYAKTKPKGSRFRTNALGIAAVERLRRDLGSATVERIEAVMVEQKVSADTETWQIQPGAQSDFIETMKEAAVDISGPEFGTAAPVARTGRPLLGQLMSSTGCLIGFAALLTSWFHHTGYFKAAASMETHKSALESLGL